MPLDPSIILGVRAPQMQDPLESYGKAAALKGLIGQQELQALQAQQVRQGIDDENAVRDAYRQGAGNMDTIRKLLGERGAYKQIQALDAAELARREKESTIGKNRAAAAKYDSEVQIKEAERAASMLSVAKENPDAYPAILRLAQVQFPNLARRLPAQYDPNVIQSELAAGMTYVQRLQDQREREKIAEGIRATNLGNETTRRGQDMVDARTREEGAANRGVTIRGQNLTDARSRDQLAQGRWTNDLERGIQVNTSTGETRPITQGGAPIGQRDKPLTESQSNATAFGMRAAESNRLLRELEDKGVTNTGVVRSTVAGTMGLTPFIGDKLESATNSTMNVLPGFLGGPSAEQQRTEQARRDFVNAVLRKESGAVISPSEFDNASKQYFPQPGDDVTTRVQKQRNREMAIRALQEQAGPGAKNIPKPQGVPDAPAKAAGWSVVR